MFENYGHLHVYSHRAGTDSSPGSILFHKHKYSVNLVIFCKCFPLNYILTVLHIYRIPIEPESSRPCVRPFTLSNKNISLTSGPVTMKFYLKHNLGAGKAAQGFE